MVSKPPCAGKTDWFVFPNVRPTVTRKALALCAACPDEHKVPCDEGAIDPFGEPDIYMIRAGRTPHERFGMVLRPRRH